MLLRLAKRVMGKLLKSALTFIRLPLQRQCFYLEALANLVCAWMLVRWIPFRYWSRWLGDTVEYAPSHVPSPAIAKNVGHTIRQLNRAFGDRFTCLMQATAGKFMLNRRKIENTLVLGVCTERNDSLAMTMKAHAWLHSGASVLLGGEVRQKFTPISSFHSSPIQRT